MSEQGGQYEGERLISYHELPADIARIVRRRRLGARATEQDVAKVPGVLRSGDSHALNDQALTEEEVDEAFYVYGRQHRLRPEEVETLKAFYWRQVKSVDTTAQN